MYILSSISNLSASRPRRIRPFIEAHEHRRTLSFLTRVTFGVSTCQKMYLGVKPSACTRTTYTEPPHNIPGDPLQSEPRLVSHHCTWGGFMNWKRTIASVTTWSLCPTKGWIPDSDRFSWKKNFFPGDTRVSPLLLIFYKRWKGARDIWERGRAPPIRGKMKNPGKHA